MVKRSFYISFPRHTFIIDLYLKTIIRYFSEHNINEVKINRWPNVSRTEMKIIHNGIWM